MTRTDDDVALDAATDPLILALDIGSTATRGGVHDASGRRVCARTASSSRGRSSGRRYVTVTATTRCDAMVPGADGVALGWS